MASSLPPHRLSQARQRSAKPYCREDGNAEPHPTPPRASPPRLGQPRKCLAVAEVEGHGLAGERGASASSLRRRRSPATSTRLAEERGDLRPKPEKGDGVVVELPEKLMSCRFWPMNCGFFARAAARIKPRARKLRVGQAAGVGRSVAVSVPRTSSRSIEHRDKLRSSEVDQASSASSLCSAASLTCENVLLTKRLHLLSCWLRQGLPGSNPNVVVVARAIVIRQVRADDSQSEASV